MTLMKIKQSAFLLFEIKCTDAYGWELNVCDIFMNAVVKEEETEVILEKSLCILSISVASSTGMFKESEIVKIRIS